MNNTDPFIQKIKQTLDQQAIDSSTRQQLAQARETALAGKQTFWRINTALPAIVMASLVAVALLITLQISDPAPALQPDSIETFEILTSRDDLELYENLDFYLWLDQQPTG